MPREFKRVGRYTVFAADPLKPLPMRRKSKCDRCERWCLSTEWVDVWDFADHTRLCADCRKKEVAR